MYTVIDMERFYPHTFLVYECMYFKKSASLGNKFLWATENNIVTPTLKAPKYTSIPSQLKKSNILSIFFNFSLSHE